MKNKKFQNKKIPQKGKKINNNYVEKYKKEISALIHLYYFENNFKNSIKIFEGNIKEAYYLINKSCIDQYKSFFEYEEIKNSLKYFVYDENIENLCCKLPINYFNKIYQKTSFSLREKEFKFITKKVQKPFKKELICLIDFTIINEKIYELLKNDLNYIKAEIYKIDNTKYIILIKNLFQEYLNEIGYLDGNNNFVPEYIFNYKDLDYNNLNNFINNNLNIFIENKNINYIQYKSIYCYKLINDNMTYEQNLSEKKDNILFIERNNKLNINSYICINCESEIEIISLKLFNDNEKDNIIEFKCHKCNLNSSIKIKDYLNKMIKNKYYYNTCCICGNNQENNTNTFYFCIKCSKIFCNDELCSLIHKCKLSTILLPEIKYICLEHMKNYEKENCYYTNYCKIDKKQLCKYCMQEGTHFHLDYIPVNISSLSPLVINNIKEEKIVFDIIYKTLNNKQLNISNLKKKKLKKELNSLQNKIKSDYDKLKNNYNIEEDKKIKEIENQNNNKIDQIKKESYNNITEQINNYYDIMTKTLFELKKENTSLDDKYDFSKKYNYINNYFSNNANIEYEKKINKIKNEFYYKIYNQNEEKNYKINKIKWEYNSLKNEAKKKKDLKIKELEDKYQKSINHIDIEMDDIQKNNIEYQIILSEIIFNTYKSCENRNYFYTKNLYMLMKAFYDNKEMNEIFKKEIQTYNKLDTQKLLESIDNKANYFNKNEEIIKKWD